MKSFQKGGNNVKEKTYRFRNSTYYSYQKQSLGGIGCLRLQNPLIEPVRLGQKEMGITAFLSPALHTITRGKQV